MGTKDDDYDCLFKGFDHFVFYRFTFFNCVGGSNAQLYVIFIL